MQTEKKSSPIRKVQLQVLWILRGVLKSKLVKNKFLLTGVLFVLWLIFFDPNSWIERISLYKNKAKLVKDKQYYKEKIIKDSLELQDIKSNKMNLEKFAREKYYMKKPNEDIFIIKKAEKKD